MELVGERLRPVCKSPKLGKKPVVRSVCKREGSGRGCGEGSALAASGAPPPVHTLAVPSPHEDAQTRHPQGSPLLQGHQSPAEEAAGLGEVWVEELRGQIPARPRLDRPTELLPPSSPKSPQFPP